MAPALRDARCCWKVAAAAAIFAVSAAVLPRPAAASAKFPDLTSGKYEVRVDGWLCHTCLRLAVQEVASLKEVERAGGDFDQETLVLTIRPNTKLKASKLQRALRRAAKRADLGAKFELLSVKYKVK
jgi:hypothetical protein